MLSDCANLSKGVSRNRVGKGKIFCMLKEILLN